MKKEEQKKIQQKVKKHLINSMFFLICGIGSLGGFLFGLIEVWQISRQDPITPRMEFIEDEIKPASRDLRRYIDSNLDGDLERYLENISYIYLKRYFDGNLDSNLGLDFELYFEHNLERNLERNLGLDFELYLGLDVERNFEINFFKKMVRIKFYSFLLKEKVIYPKYYRQVSELLLKELNQIIEMPQKFGLTENQEFLTTEQKQSTLAQFSLMTTLSAIGLTLFLLLLIKQRDQGVTWSMTGMYLLPEEGFAEMETLCEALQADDVPEWKIRLVLLWNVLDFLKSYYIQVKIEDLFLPNENTSD